MAFSSLYTTFTNSVVMQSINSSKETEIEFITNFITTDLSKSILLIAFLCWTKVEKFEVLKRMSQKNILTSVFNITDMEYVEHYWNSENILFLTDLDCDSSLKIMAQANDKKLFAAPYKWLLLSEKSEYVKHYEDLLSYSLYVDNNIYLACRINKEEYSILELYKYTNESDFMVMKTSENWKMGSGFLDNRPRSLLQLNRGDVNGTLIKSSVVFLDDDSLNHLTDYRFRHIDAISKVNYILSNIIVEYMNGTKEFDFVKTWGYINPTDNMYTGMIGALQRNKAEIGSTPLFITPDRIPIIEYVAITTPTTVKFIFRQPPLSYMTNVFTLPFSGDVWLCSIGLCILVTILMYITVALEWRSFPPNSITMLPTLSEAFLVTMDAMTQQGATSEPRTGAGKTVMFITLIALMFLYVSYSANILALLQSPATNIKTLNDLLKSRLDLGVDDTVYNRYYFEHATEPIRKAIYEQKVAPKGQNPRFMTLLQGVSRMREGLFAFNGELNAVYKLVQDSFLETEKCGLMEIQYIDVNYPYMAIRKNSTYKEIIKIGLRKLQESGIQSREVHMLYSKKPECHSGGGNFVIVGLIDVYAAFLILGSGMALSVFLSLVQIVVHRKSGKNCLI